MTRWNRVLPDEGTAASPTAGPVTLSLCAGPWVLSLDFPTTAATPDDLQNLRERVRCLALLWRVPAEGLPEIRDALCRVIQYHYQMPPPPALPARTTAAPARVGKVLARPPLLLDDDA